MNVMSVPVAGESVPRGSADAQLALACLYEVPKVLARTEPLPRALGAVLELLARVLGLEHGLVTAVDAAGAAHPLAATGGAASEAAQGAAAPFLADIVATALPVVDRAPAGAEGAKWVRIGVPLLGGDDVVGTLSVERMRRPGLAGSCDEDVRLLVLVARLLAPAVAEHRLPRAAPEGGPGEAPTAPDGASCRARDLGIIGSSAPLAAALDKAARAARTNLAVLLRGESGTGKELFAHAVHRLSARAGGPFVKVNCAALPESMLESELFGHERGAFTGAFGTRKGRFELADGGTLFLDEIGDISPAFQAKLLRVLQEGEFERVGGTKTLKVNVRIVAATNRDLEAAVAEGRFRADLYYRLGVVPIALPTLRERPGDIPMLARHILQRFNAEHRARLRFGIDAVELVRSCHFPGNVRELENCIRRTAVLAEGPEIAAADFACRKEGCSAAFLARRAGVEPAGSDAADARRAVAPDREAPAAETWCPRPGPAAAPMGPGCGGPPRSCRPGRGRLPDAAVLIDAMETAGWVQAKAARLLHLTPRQVAYALSRHGIDIKKF